VKNLTNFNRPYEELTKAVISFGKTKSNTMKTIFFTFLLSVSFLMVLLTPANAQDKGQKKIHVVIEENGTVITDTTVFFDSDVSEQDIEAAISCITGEKSRPCHAHNQSAMTQDTLVLKCRHMQKSELDSLLEAEGKPSACNHSDTCMHAHGPCMKHAEKDGADLEPCKHMEKEIMIIETGDEEKDKPEGCVKKEFEKKVIITKEGDKAEKTIILESPAESEKKAKKEN
jgi:hypothetical protein